jgi:hypothetical protein
MTVQEIFQYKNKIRSTVAKLKEKKYLSKLIYRIKIFFIFLKMYRSIKSHTKQQMSFILFIRMIINKKYKKLFETIMIKYFDWVIIIARKSIKRTRESMNKGVLVSEYKITKVLGENFIFSNENVSIISLPYNIKIHKLLCDYLTKSFQIEKNQIPESDNILIVSTDKDILTIMYQRNHAVNIEMYYNDDENFLFIKGEKEVYKYTGAQNIHISSLINDIMNNLEYNENTIVLSYV